jgi:amino-acid N-acetyltransferase
MLPKPDRTDDNRSDESGAGRGDSSAPGNGGGCPIGPATAADLPAIARLLHEAGLPQGDIAGHVGRFLVARNDAGGVVGTIGAEVTGPDALLRSLAVAPNLRQAGLGGRLMAELERVAGGWGVQRWWLLTTTAERFFAKRGFRVATRCEAPEGIRRTAQFSGGCAAAAVCLTRERRSDE